MRVNEADSGRRLGLVQSAVLALGAITLSGCVVGPNFEPPRPDVPRTWSAASAPAAESRVVTEPVQQLDWWKSFNDAGLNSLIERAATANLDVRAAVLRVAEVRAERQAVASAAWPTVNGNASA